MDVAESTLLLIDDQGEPLVKLSIDAMALATLKGYLQICAETPVHKQLRASLSSAMDSAIQQAIPYHLRRPSEAQLSYALGIAKALDIAVPPEALSQRWAMHEFLDCHVEIYRLRQAGKGRETAPPPFSGIVARSPRALNTDETQDVETLLPFE